MAKIKVKILFEDSQILVCNKPAEVAVTKSETTKLPTLQDWLAEYFHLGKNAGIGQRAGIVHRLDKQTSGIILVAKTPKAFEFLQKQFAKRQVLKKYLALTHGIPASNLFTIDLPIARQKWGRFAVKSTGRTALTTFRVLKRFQFGPSFEKICQKLPKFKNYFVKYAKFYSLIEASPSTGRTHQIRVHAKAVKLPIVSDPLYLPKRLLKFDLNFCPRQFLHAIKITFIHPEKLTSVTFEAKLPTDLEMALQYLKEA